MTKTALVTGASSGIGRELARYHASQGGDVIVTARREDALQTLKSELESAHSINVTVIALDLGASDGAARLYEAVKAANLTVDYLINNAGFGGRGAFLERELAQDLDMIRLNVEALVSLCHMFGKDMAAKGGGKILNVSSTAAYMPGPLQATYFATKAHVSSFSQALAEELKGEGITVTALEPGYVITEFAEKADLVGTKLVAQKGATAEVVAKFGYDAMIDGQLTAINDRFLAFTLGWVMPFLPRRLQLGMVRKMQEK